MKSAAEWVKTATLKPWVKNPRRNNHAVKAVADSIARFGFGAPIVARRADGRVIAGHTRLKAAILLKLDEVPVRYLDISEDEADALALADNKLGEAAEWDPEALLTEIRNGRDLLALGWGEAELADLTAADGDEDVWATGDKPASPQRVAMVTLVVSTDASPAIEAAIDTAMKGSTTRGDALARICREWTDAAR